MQTRGIYTLEFVDDEDILFDNLYPLLLDFIDKDRLDNAYNQYHGKTKLPLSIIDAFTTCFEDEKSISSYLKKNTTDIRIYYMSQGKKYTSLSLIDRQSTRKLSISSFNTCIMDMATIENIIEKLVFYRRIDKNMDKYLSRRNCFCDKFEEDLDDFTRAIRKNYSDIRISDTLGRVERHFTYRLLRDMMEAFEDYENKNLTTFYSGFENTNMPYCKTLRRVNNE